MGEMESGGGGAARGGERSPQAKAVEAFIRLAGMGRKFRSEAAARRAMEAARRGRLEGRRNAAGLSRELARGLARLRTYAGAEPVEGHPVLRFAPRGARRDLALFYLHGGAYVFDPSPRHLVMLDRLAERCGLEVVAPLYPKAPEHAQAESLAWVERRWAEAAAGRRLVLGGDSAGGGLALALAMLSRDRGGPAPELLLLLSPWLDLAMGHPEHPAYEACDPMLAVPGLRAMGAAWAGGAPAEDPLLSPGRGELRGLPRTLLFAGTRELFLPDCRDFRDRALAEGLALRYEEFEGMNHVFPVLPVPEAELALGLAREELARL